MSNEDDFEEDDDSTDWDQSESEELQQVECPHCGCEVDDESLICPVCQKSLRPRTRINTFFVVALVLTLVVLFLWPFFGWLFQLN
jgi:hypothetical protein